MSTEHPVIKKKKNNWELRKSKIEDKACCFSLLGDNLHNKEVNVLQKGKILGMGGEILLLLKSLAYAVCTYVRTSSCSSPRILTSAGSTSPRRHRITSPGTKSAASIVSYLPLRRALALGASDAVSAAMALSAEDSS